MDQPAIATPSTRRAARRSTRAEPPPAQSGVPAPAMDAFFARRTWTPWTFQRDAWDAHADGRSGLICVGTGAGKTYAAYGGALNELAAEALATRAGVGGLRVVYITPLRAVSRDIELALREPIDELGLPITLASRTGDTPGAARTRLRRRPPNVLVTTPESLTLMLSWEDAPELFAGVRAVILDEWHELLGTKRGTQVELGVARLRGLATGPGAVRVWALSATLPNVDEAARAAVGVGREPVIIAGDAARDVHIDSILPGDDKELPLAGHLGLGLLPEVASALDPRVSTIVFTNTRSQAERWFHALALARPDWVDRMALHHGSIDRADRERVEGGVKSGAITLVVATSSLDLGVDFAPVERVIQIGSPKGIARLVQRAGRSSHRPRTPCRITCVPTHALELIEIAAARRALAAGRIEARRPLERPFDVLAQHLVTCALGGGFRADALYDEVRRAWSYRELAREEFNAALALVERGGDSLHAYPQYHRVRADAGVHRGTSPRLAQLHRLNIGTITGDGTIEIALRSGRRLGRIEESFVAGLREGQTFVFAGRVVAFVGIRDAVAYVRASSGRSSYTPIWGGTRLPISECLGEAIRDTLVDAARLVVPGDGPGRVPCPASDPELLAAAPIIAIQARESRVPGRGETLIEVARSREGTHVFVFPFEGRLVHAGMAAVTALRLARIRAATFSIAASDYGYELVAPGRADMEGLMDAALFSPAGLMEDALEGLALSRMARLQFREVARVAGLVLQTYPGASRPARQVQASSTLLFDVLSEFEPSSPLLAQARREVLERQFERSRLTRAVERIHASRLVVATPARFTPLSFPLVIERQAGTLSTQSLAERVAAMRAAWQSWEAS